MTVKDVMEEALSLLGRGDAATVLKQNALDSAEAEIKELVETLLYCFNAVEDELARFYFPLEFVENIRGSGGKFYFSSFTYRPVSLVSISVDGREAEYTRLPQYILANAEIITVRYMYTPQKKDLSGDSAFDGTTVGARLIACGMAAEYCVINGEIGSADMWESRYRREIDRTRLKYAPALRIPPRRWV